MRLTAIIFSFCLITSLLSAQQSEGIATYYDDKFEGRPTANGDIFDQNKLTAAHRTLGFGTILKVTNLQNKKSVVVTVNDRGPFVDSRLIDLSKSAATALGFVDQGLTRVRIDVIKAGESDAGSETTKPAVELTSANQSSASSSMQDENEVHFPNEYYQLDIKFAKPAGFAIQVGSFTELANLMRMAQELRRIYGKDLLVQVTDVNNRKVHRLMVGPFPERESAELTLRSLKDDFVGSFVLELK
jgi:rare lipoprotein A